MAERAQAAVLVPLYRDHADELRLVLIRRVQRGLHGGQIAFPGGRPEPADASPQATALREAHEEIGLAPERVEILAALPRVATLSSGFDIQPFLGRVRPPPAWRPSHAEVAAVLTPMVAALADPSRVGSARVGPPVWPQTRVVDCLHLDAETFVWGATYRILRPLLAALNAGRWPL